MQKETWAEHPYLIGLGGFQYCDILLDFDRTVEVLERARKDLQSAESNRWLLEAALDHLSLGRVHLAALQSGAKPHLDHAKSHIAQAMEGLRRTNAHEFIPLGLLARAELYIHTREFANARRDLDEAMTIATRCGFRLHECDAHLGYARLAIAEGNRTMAAEHLEKARKIVEETGYHRRDGELAALESKIAGMPDVALAPIVESNSYNETHIKGKSIVSGRNNEHGFDIVIFCALPSELKRVRNTGMKRWTDFSADPDPTTYWETIYTTSKGTVLRVVAAAPHQMGMPAAAVLATKAIRHFSPRLVVMTGIAAGVKEGGRNFGDILVPDCTFDYGAGKISQNIEEAKLEFQPEPNPIKIATKLKSRLLHWRDHKGAALHDIREGFDGRTPDTVLKMHVGPLGSGAAVLAASNSVNEVRNHWRKLIGIEMEAYGVHLACEESVHPPPMFLCMKSVCDFADEKKNDDWQHYAAYTSAQLCHRFLTEEWENLFPR